MGIIILILIYHLFFRYETIKYNQYTLKIDNLTNTTYVFRPPEGWVKLNKKVNK